MLFKKSELLLFFPKGKFFNSKVHSKSGQRYSHHRFQLFLGYNHTNKQLKQRSSEHKTENREHGLTKPLQNTTMKPQRFNGIERVTLSTRGRHSLKKLSERNVLDLHFEYYGTKWTQ